MHRNKFLGLAAVLVPLVLFCRPVSAQRLGRSLAERVDARSTFFFRVGISSPAGREIKDEFGPRIPLGVELRTNTRYGIGSSLTMDGWWGLRGPDDAVSLFLPLSAGLYYAYPLLDSAVVPYGGLFASAAWGSFVFAADSAVRWHGLGGGGGIFAGVEVPLLHTLAIRVDNRLYAGSISAEAEQRETAARRLPRRRIRTTNFSLMLGMTMGFNDLFWW